ncbi:protein of unknown function DUF2229 [Gottschalkia purinilytica]|uniref:DUF2229 domain-containing protein n=1 Tax=Gottschalkia purinilytica TaxID=1503 RepID=A0A0L0WDQ5_GOTPU|nr:acyl-CoA dehydratase activase-related protein [Gottschalkia purinilytica]KNF09545.1 protein of unknown function DUF2229 [Gottschalkia purinilytica]
MTYKVGIPRGLLFYEYYPLWKEFFNELEVEVVLSNKTNKEILNKGVSSSVDELCLPVKAYHGHVEDLKNKVDYIFIPKIMSVQKREYTCPKILGLPEVVKNSIKELPNMIDVHINLSKNNFNIVNSVLEVGKYFTSNPYKIMRAYNKAINKYKKYNEMLVNGVNPIRALENYDKNVDFKKLKEKRDLNIMVVGHSYNIYDDYISMNTIRQLEDQNINVITPEMISLEKVNYYSKKLPKRMFWTFGRRIVGAAFNAIEENLVDGIIYISSFGCGLDSILVEIVQRESRRFGMPFTLLTIDEHSGQAGVNTRIEAFVDMIKWRERNEDNFSTHG